LAIKNEEKKMPVINSKKASGEKMVQELVQNIVPILMSDYQLVSFFDLYFGSFMTQGIIINYSYHIRQDIIEINLCIVLNKSLIIEIDRRSANYKISEKGK
jgi:hypothetical protein